MSNDIEIWKPIEGYEGLYEISSHGRHRSVERTVISKIGRRRHYDSKIMSVTNEGSGCSCTLRRDNKSRKQYIHYVVAAHFLDNPHGYEDVIHIDSDITNNRVSNLRYISPKEIRVLLHGATESSCLHCGKEMIVSRAHTKKGFGKYCSHDCHGKAKKGRRGQNAGRTFPYKPRPKMQGKVPWNRGKKGHQSWNKGKDYPQVSGEKHWNWKGGSSNKSCKIRNTPEYRRWKKEVLARDGKHCFFCGETEGQFHVDHIKPFVDNPDLRFEPSNGRMVCVECHRKTPTYGTPPKQRSIANKKLKRRIIELSYKHHVSHLGSNLTAVDIILKIFKTKADDERFYLSAGHYALALFVVLEYLYDYDAEELMLRHGSHCKKDEAHQIYCINGSLGCVVGIALGNALANRSRKVHVLISDGEVAEGSVTEALKIKREHKLTNLVVHLNMNGLGAYGLIDTEEMMRDLLFIDRSLRIHHTNPNQLPFLKDLDAHYLVMNEENYKTAMEILK